MPSGFPLSNVVPEIPAQATHAGSKKDPAANDLGFLGVLMANRNELPIEKIETNQGELLAKDGQKDLVVAPDGADMVLGLSAQATMSSQTLGETEASSTSGVEVVSSPKEQTAINGLEPVNVPVIAGPDLAKIEAEVSLTKVVDGNDGSKSIMLGKVTLDTEVALDTEGAVEDLKPSTITNLAGQGNSENKTVKSAPLETVPISKQELGTTLAKLEVLPEAISALDINAETVFKTAPAIVSGSNQVMVGDQLAPLQNTTKKVAGDLASGLKTHPEMDLAGANSSPKELSVESVLALQAKRILQGQDQVQAQSSTYSKPANSAAAKASIKLENKAAKLEVLSSRAENVAPKAEAAPAAKRIDVYQPVIKPANPEIETHGTEAKKDAGEVLDPEKTTPQRAKKAISLSPKVSSPLTQNTAANYSKIETGLHSVPNVTQEFSSSNMPANMATAEATPTHNQNPVNQMPVFRQVVQGLEIMAGGTKVTLQLNPESLGKVDITLTVKDMALEVRLVAENPQAAESLQNNIHELTKSLQDKASRYHHLDIQVETKDAGRPKAENAQPDRRDQERGQERNETRDSRQQNSGNRHRPSGGNPGKGEPDYRWQQAMKEDV